MSTFSRRALLVVVLALAALGSFSWSAAAAPAGPAHLRLAHLSPDTPSVDVYVTSVSDGAGTFVVTGVGYGALSDYRAVPAGSYVVSMRPAGAPASSAAVISTTLEARPGDAYTIAGVGLFAQLGLTVLPDQLTAPAPGRASVRVINAAVTRPDVDLAPAGGPVWARDVRFGTQTGYVDVPLGTWDCDVTADGQVVAELPVSLVANSVYTVLLVDKGAGLQAELHTDSAGASVVPRGAVETGMGGAAPEQGAGGLPPVDLMALVALVAVATATAAAHRARRRAGHRAG